MGNILAYGSLPFRNTGFPVQDVFIFYVSDMINIWGTVSSFIHLSVMFLSTDIFFGRWIGWYKTGSLYIRFTY